MTDEPIDFQEPPPPAPATVDELHVWIGVFRNGGEDVLNGRIEGFDRALMHMHREMAETFGPVARSIQRETQDGPSPMIRIELRTYRRV